VEQVVAVVQAALVLAQAAQVEQMEAAELVVA